MDIYQSVKDIWITIGIIFYLLDIHFLVQGVPMTNTTQKNDVLPKNENNADTTVNFAAGGSVYEKNVNNTTEKTELNSFSSIVNNVNPDSVTTGNQERDTTASVGYNSRLNTTGPYSKAKFDPMALLKASWEANIKKNFKPNQCKSVYEPVLISAGLMKPHSANVHIVQTVNVTNSSNTEKTKVKNVTDADQLEKLRGDTEEHEYHEEYDDETSTYDSENMPEYYNESYNYEEYYYDDYEPEELVCCKRYGVSEDCLDMCLGDRFFDCSMLCKYMFDHIAKTCIHGYDRLSANEHMPPSKFQ